MKKDNIEFDLNVADNGKYRNQEEWIELYNSQKGEYKGKKMISAPDIYLIGKSASDEVLNSLRNHFDNRWIILNTRISYNKNNLSGVIIHDVVERKLPVIPVYDPVSLEEVLSEGNGVKYVRALFNTRDSIKTISEVLENISRRKAGNINLWTPNQSSRNSYPERSVRFYGGNDKFHVNGYIHFIDSSGRSCGMLIKK